MTAFTTYHHIRRMPACELYAQSHIRVRPDIRSNISTDWKVTLTYRSIVGESHFRRHLKSHSHFYNCNTHILCDVTPRKHLEFWVRSNTSESTIFSLSDVAFQLTLSGISTRPVRVDMIAQAEFIYADISAPLRYVLSLSFRQWNGSPHGAREVRFVMGYCRTFTDLCASLRSRKIHK